MKKLFLIFVLLVSACEADKVYPTTWDVSLDPFMEVHGYTMDAARVTIYKNGYAVWYDEPCYGRGCFNSNRSLVPHELSESVRLDYITAITESKKEFIQSISDKIGINKVDK